MRVVVCGAGSAGLMSALAIQHKNRDFQIEILRDSGTPVIGVGESTFGSFPRDIQTHLGLDFAAFEREVQPVTKYGLWLGFGAEDFHYSFENTFDWRWFEKPYPEGFYIRRPFGHNDFSREMIAGRNPPEVSQQAGLHIENQRFLAHLERVCRSRGIAIHDEPIEAVERDGDRVVAVNGRHRADLFVDCTGFAARLTREEWVSYGDALLNDRALFLWLPRERPIRPYTKASTMPNGWLWEIDHRDGVGIGYVYASRFVSDADAARELERVIGPFPPGRVVRFDPGARRRHWVGNVVSIGNSDGFIEPLEATTLTIILRCAVDVSEVLSNRFDRTDLVARYEANVADVYTNVRDFILMHFAFNERLDTPYWRAYRSRADRITKGSISEFILDYYRRNGPSIKFVDRMHTSSNFFGIEGYYTLFKGLGVPTAVDAVMRETCGEPAAPHPTEQPRTRFDEAQVSLALRLAQEGASGEEIDRRIGRAGSAVTLTRIEAVSEAAIRAIARDVFGTDAEVESVEPIAPLVQHGIARRSGFTGNLLYRVSLRRTPGAWAFRFNRGFREDVYDQECENYRRVSEATGVRVPQIAAVDRAQRHVPAAFMILEWLDGDPWQYLVHPANPDTTPAEKAAIRRRTGELFAALHARSRPASDAMEEARQILWGVYRLEEAVRAGRLPLDPARIARCREVVENDPVLRVRDASLCFVDAEICFARDADAWRLAFVCDAEWVTYRDRYSDLVTHLVPGVPLWELDEPLVLDDPDAIARDPFFESYARRGEVDFARLAQLPAFHQLRGWGHALTEERPAALAEWLWRRKGPLLAAVVERVAARG